MLDKLKALHARASSVPWQRIDSDDSPTPRVGYRIQAGSFEANHVAAEYRHDAALIIAAVNALPALLECIEAAESMADAFSEIDESAIEGAALNAYRAARAKLDEVK